MQKPASLISEYLDGGRNKSGRVRMLGGKAGSELSIGSVGDGVGGDGDVGGRDGVGLSFVNCSL